MANVMVLGVGPMPIERAEKIHAPGIRVWQIAKLIAKQKHHVLIGLIQFGDFHDGEESGAGSRPESLGENLAMIRLKYHSVRTPEALATIHLRSRFSCVVSTTDIMNSLAATMPAQVPLWLDYLGDPFTEKQLMTAGYGNNDCLMDQWRLMFKALAAGDRFSVASTPQKYALIGQLGLVGRLNQFTAGTDLVHVIPNCSQVMNEKESHVRVQLKGRGLPDNCFILMWTGGYNNWADPETLFAGVSQAMRKNPKVYYVSVGGELAGHDEVTFTRFRKLVEASDLAPRFHFVGWIPNQEMPVYYRLADAAINIDAKSYEAEIGTRTRIMDWIQFKIPVITTALCEPAKMFAENDLITVFEPENADSLSQAILSVAEDLPGARERAARCQEFFDAAFHEKRVFAPLLEWVEHPAFAPDRIISSRIADAQPPVDCGLVAMHRRFLLQHESPIDLNEEPSLLTRFIRKLSKITGAD